MVSNSTTTTSTGLITDTTQNASDKKKLDASLAIIAQDPDGAKLMARAKALGVKISAGDPATAAGPNDVAVVCNCPMHQAMRAAADEKALSGQATAQKDADSSTVVVRGVTLSNASGGDIRIVVKDPTNIKTITHELVHAVSTGDGDSKEEEGIADVIGSRVANRNGGTAVGGLTGSEQQIYLNKQQYYPTLKQTNDIRNSLAAVGISANV